MHSSILTLPGDPLFNLILHSFLPPGWQGFANQNPDFAFVVRAESGILEPVSLEDLEEYVEGGEYDERLIQMGEYADADDY